MSWELPEGAVIAPHHRGMIQGENPNDPRQYQFYAYRHAHGLSWFGGSRRRPGTETEDGGMTHYILSGVRGEIVPPRPDEAVAAITGDQYIELIRAELRWWNDRITKIIELTVPLQLQYHGRPVRELPGIEAFEKQGIKWAHRMVARRADAEDELPDDHDDRVAFGISEEGIEWGLM